LVLAQEGSIESKIASKQHTRGSWDPPCGQEVGLHGPPISFLIVFPVGFFFSRSSISQKNDVAKSLGPFDVRKVPQTQKHAKQENLLRSVKTG
jgi:hypothetical protein